MKQKPFNLTSDNCAFTIRARYGGLGINSFIHKGKFFPATGVLEIYNNDFEKQVKTTKNE